MHGTGGPPWFNTAASMARSAPLTAVRGSDVVYAIMTAGWQHHDLPTDNPYCSFTHEPYTIACQAAFDSSI
jgi:hypothetical protein